MEENIQNPTLSSEEEKKKNRYLPYMLVFCIPVLLYVQTTGFGYTRFDDTHIISNNIKYLSDFSNVPQVFLKGAFLSNNSSFYRPLQTASYMLDIKLSGGENPWMFHLTNIFILGFIALFLFLLLKKLSIPPNLALLTVLIYSAHPLFVSSIAWIPARGDLFLVLFSLLSFLFLHNYFSRKRNIYLIGHWIAFTFALFSKETAAFLPLLFILYFLVFLYEKGTEKKFLILLPFYAVSGLFWYWLRYKAIGGSYDFEKGVFGVKAFILNIRVIPEALSKFLIPLDLDPVPSFSLFNTVVGILLIVVLLVVLVKGWSKESGRKKLFGLAWFLILLLPTMLFKQTHIDYLDHRFFIPLIGIVLFLLFSIPEKWFKKGNIRNSWSLVVIFLLLCIYTFNHSKAYANPTIYWDTAIKQNDNSPFAYNNRGYIRMRAGDFPGALEDYNHSIALSHDYYMSLSDRGWVKSKMGDNSGALNDLNKALAINDRHDVSYYRRGVVYLNTGNTEQAISDFNHLLTILPDNPQAYNYLGLAYIRLGNFQEAIKNLNRAIEIDPNFIEAYSYRAIAKYSLKDFTGAIKDCNLALRINPRDKRILNIKAEVQREYRAVIQ